MAGKVEAEPDFVTFCDRKRGAAGALPGSEPSPARVGRAGQQFLQRGGRLEDEGASALPLIEQPLFGQREQVGAGGLICHAMRSLV